MSDEAAARVDRLAKNTVLSVLSWLVPIALGFVATPILVRRLGADEYGLYATIAGFMAYSFNFSIGRIAAKYVAEFSAGGDEKKIDAAVLATLIFSVGISSAGYLILALLARYIVNDVLMIDSSSAGAAIIALYLAGAVVFATMVAQVFQFTLQGFQRFGTFLVITNVNAALLGGGNIVIALAGGGFVELLIWNTVAAVGSAAVSFAAVRRFIFKGKSALRLELPLARSVAKYGSSIILYQIFANLLFILERVILVRRFGTESVTYYSVPMMLAIYMQSFVVSIAAGIFPLVNELLGDLRRQTELYKRAVKLILAIVAFTVGSVVGAGAPALAVWIDQDFSEKAYPLFVFHVAAFAITAAAVPAWNLAEGYERAAFNAYISAAILVIAAALMFFPAAAYGPNAVALSRLAATAAVAPVVLIAERLFLGKSLYAFWLALFAKIFPALVIAGLSEYVIVTHLPLGWTALILSGFVGSGVFLAVLYLTGYADADEQELVKAALSRHFGRALRALR